MKVGSLFSGIGGLELGLERAGMKVVWQVERDEFCRRVLAKHWPDVQRFEDVHDVGAHNLEPVDLICGGFPCQPVSVAGKRKAQDDERWLWPEFARIIRELRPRYALMENVPGLLVRGIGDVLGDLAEIGYNAEWECLSAGAFGAPHRRERVFLVAYDHSQRIEGLWTEQVRRVAAFSWCQDVRGPTGFRGRPDIPDALVRRKGDGHGARVDALGNAVVPQVAEWIGERILEAGRAEPLSDPTGDRCATGQEPGPS